MDLEAQHSTKLKPFDPSEHGADVAQAFEKFIRLFKRKYIAWGRTAPQGTENVNQWKEQDKLRQLLGHYCTDHFMDDKDAAATENELETATFDNIIGRLRDHYKRHTNQTMAPYKFHCLQQSETQSFDSFVNEIKNTAKNCHFKCAAEACDVADTLLRDQIIIGFCDEEFRKNALKEEWTLQEVENNGRRAKAAARGAAAMTEDPYSKVERTYGKYSRKKTAKYRPPPPPPQSRSHQKRNSSFVCYCCNRNRCDQNACPARKSYCHQCNEKGHWSGSIICQGAPAQRPQSLKPKHQNRKAQTRYINETSTSAESDASSPAYSSESSCM